VICKVAKRLCPRAPRRRQPHVWELLRKKDRVKALFSSIVKAGSGMRRLVHPIMDNSLSIALFALFAICITGQSLAGWRVQNDTPVAHGQTVIAYWRFLRTGVFLEGLASNWQTAVLQLGSLIIFGAFLYQRGAPHSRNPRKTQHKQTRLQISRFSWLYRNSLSMAFLALFLIALSLHIVFGTQAYNEARALTSQPTISIAACLHTATFWSATLQTWQAEYLVIAIYVVLTTFLRQQGSPESKPVESRNETTGAENK
jgi:hypothetical protein